MPELMQKSKTAKVRYGFARTCDVDVGELADKQGCVAEVLEEICRKHFPDVDMPDMLRPGRIDVELCTDGSEGPQERAIRLSDEWQSIAPLIEAGEQVELGMARHIDGGNTKGNNQ